MTDAALPTDAHAAVARLVDGNCAFRDPERAQRPIALSSLGIADQEGRVPPQRPYAAVLGCSDARVPIELVFQQASNDLFVVRVAGNVLGDECLGSLEFAADKLKDSVRLVVVLGHGGCGAVTAAVEAYLDPATYPGPVASQALRSVVDKILPAVRAADVALEEVHGAYVRSRPGYREALIETSVVLNAALAAMTLRRDLRDLPVVYGVFDLVSRSVDLVDPPGSTDSYRTLGRTAADAPAIRTLVMSG